MSTKVIVADDWLNCENRLGKFLDESDYDFVVDYDCDFYAPSDNSLFGGDEVSEDKCIFKFRKNFFTEEEQVGAYEGLSLAAGESQNRGLAAGERDDKLQNREWVTERQAQILVMMMNPPDNVFGESALKDAVYDKNAFKGNSNRGKVWLMTHAKEFDFEEWAEETILFSEADMIKEAKKVSGWISNTTYANPVLSGVAGWFDRYPRIPYGRATSYTRDNFKTFQKAYPFLQKLAKGFKELLPERYSNQEEACKSIDERFYVPETPFTTITVNKTFRTAAHRDAGDLNTGFSNLSVITNKKNAYKGGYLILPEFRVAINIRPGDLLLINNHEGIHGNSPIEIDEGGERVSIVCYFREKMLELGSKEYEDARFQFVESRRKNNNHPLWKERWNGVSEGMFFSDEWYSFLLESLGEEALLKYHPESIKEEKTYGVV